MLEKSLSKGNSLTLLVKVETDTASMENSMELP